VIFFVKEKENKTKTILNNLVINTITHTHTYSKTTYRNFSQIKLEKKSMESNKKKTNIQRNNKKKNKKRKREEY